MQKKLESGMDSGGIKGVYRVLACQHFAVYVGGVPYGWKPPIRG